MFNCADFTGRFITQWIQVSVICCYFTQVITRNYVNVYRLVKTVLFCLHWQFLVLSSFLYSCCVTMEIKQVCRFCLSVMPGLSYLCFSLVLPMATSVPCSWYLLQCECVSVLSLVPHDGCYCVGLWREQNERWPPLLWCSSFPVDFFLVLCVLSYGLRLFWGCRPDSSISQSSCTIACPVESTRIIYEKEFNVIHT